MVGVGIGVKVASGLVKLGGKLFKGAARRRKRKAKRKAAKAAKAAKAVTDLQALQANFFGGTGGSESMGSDQVSAAGNALQAIKSQGGNDEVEPMGTSVTDVVGGGMKFNPMWAVYAVGGYVVLKALKIIK